MREGIRDAARSYRDGLEKGSFDWRHMLRALRWRNFRIYFIGQAFSLTGTWMQRVALGWLVYRLTDSETMLGVVSFAGRIPNLLVLPFSGVLADRVNRHRVMMVARGFAMLQAAGLAALVLTGAVRIWHVVALSLVMGVIFAMDAPSRQAFIFQVIGDRADLSNAVALHSAVFNLARLVGPALAGLLVALTGEGPVFAVNALSYLVVLGALAMVRVEPPPDTRRGGTLGKLREGLSYAARTPPVRAILLLLVSTSLLAFPYLVLMPAFARSVLGGDARTLGWLMGSVGAGALLGAAFISSRRDNLFLWHQIPVSGITLGLGIALFSLSRSVPLSCGLLVLPGFGLMTLMACCNTVLQSLVPESARGRVMSLYYLSFLGVMPIGSLVMGALAEHFGTAPTVMAGGLLSTVASLFFAAQIGSIRCCGARLGRTGSAGRPTG